MPVRRYMDEGWGSGEPHNIQAISESRNGNEGLRRSRYVLRVIADVGLWNPYFS
jgi:hypothetical protein